ncbi:MAG: hypothetical protein LBR06_03925 [Bacteroidales bacterium]|jgi:hypothetical protein|nr:hypothetical protein [Bacteroidales bacterium]
MYKNACVSADIVASRSLESRDLQALTAKTLELLDLLSAKYNTKNRTCFCGRLVKGDYVECVVRHPGAALRTVMLLKCGIKSFVPQSKAPTAIAAKMQRLFRSYGIRAAIGMGDMYPVTTTADVWTGEAIIRSGRLIEQQKTSDKDRPIVKRTLFFDAGTPHTTRLFDSILRPLDYILNRATARQSEILFWRLYGKSEAETGQLLTMSQAAVNQQAASAGWNALESALTFFEQYNF